MNSLASVTRRSSNVKISAQCYFRAESRAFILTIFNRDSNWNSFTYTISRIYLLSESATGVNS